MDVRQRRLQADKDRLMELARRSTRISVQECSSLGDKFVVTYRCRGLLWLPGNPSPSITTDHRLGIYLHVNYPRTPPRLQWLTDIFHPNILSPNQNGGVCIGSWTPAETLDQLVLRIGEMVQYKNYNTRDPLNLDAADWIEQHRHMLPVDNSPLVDSDNMYEDIRIEVK